MVAGTRGGLNVAKVVRALIRGALFVVFIQGSLNADRANDQKERTVTQRPFGMAPDGRPTRLFVCSNARGSTMSVTDYGARLVALDMPDRDGKMSNVTLSLDSAEKYGAHTAYFGCTTGRYANRIAKATFTLDGTPHRLAANIGENHLHGGVKGFDRHVWKAEEVRTRDAVGVKFTLRSPDGDEGYPGTLDVTVTYSLTEMNELRLEYSATTDKPTVLNLTNHAYWNLAGAGSGDILGHKLLIAADHFLPVGDGIIPTGKLASVEVTYMDFRELREIGSRFAETKKGVPAPGGYDHCYVLRGSKGELALAARVEEPGSGRVMEVYTTEPAMQLYTGNYLDGDSKNGGFKQHSAFCLETQHYPDSPNQPAFPSTVLRPRQSYRQVTVYKFLTAR